MEKKASTVITIHDDTDSQGVCGKLFTMIRRISSRQASPVTPRDRSHLRAVKFIDIVNGSPTGVNNDIVLVRDERKPKPKPEPKAKDDGTSPRTAPTVIVGSKKIPEEKPCHDPLNQTFNDYLNRIRSIIASPEVDHGNRWEKNKVAASVSAGPDHHHHHHQQQHHENKKKESVKDHISDYIHRTKFMIRSHPPASATAGSATTAAATGKNVSLKTEF